MAEYFCAGYVVFKGNKKGIAFLRYKDGEVLENDVIAFGVKKSSDFPVGWIIDIKKKGNSYSGFKYAGKNHSGELTEKYRLTSTANVKAFELEQLRKRKKKIIATIENMTIKELKEWVKESPTNKKSMKFYLWELF